MRAKIRMVFCPTMDASDLRAWESAENSRNKGSTFSHNSWSYIKPQISSATNAACNSNSNATYLVSYWPPWTAEEGGIASFFGKVLGLVLAPKMCPHQSQGFKEVNISQAFTVGRRKNAIFFLDEPLPGAPRHPCTKFRASIRRTVRTVCVGPVLSQI